MEGMTFSLIVVLILNVLNFAFSVDEDNSGAAFTSMVSSIILLICIGVLIFKY